MANQGPTLVDDLKSLRIEREKPARAIPRWLAPAVAAAALAALALLAWKELAPQLLAPEVETTTVALVSPAQAQQLLVATGYVVPQRKANVAPRIGGRVAKILVDDGSVVKAGQVIAVLEDAEYRAQLLQAQADEKAARARVKRAEVDLLDAQRAYGRERALHDQGFSTPQALDQATARLDGSKAALAAANAEAAAARARVELARVSLDNCYMRAPFSGRITQKLTDVGEIVFGAMSAGAGPNAGIASLADFSSLMVEADVNESQVARLKSGTPAEIVLDAFPDKRYRGRVHEVRPRVDRAKATVTVKVAFVDPAADVLPDMGAKVTFLAKEPEAAEARPIAAVQPDALADRGENKVLWVVDQDGTVKSVPVVTGPPLGRLVSLKSGPPSGTRVVLRPPPVLKPGMKVKEKQS